MVYATDDLLQTLKRARERSGQSQRDLSVRIGVPQSHLSKIESGSTDLRLSSLVELARALDYELVLVPRKLLPAVEAVARTASSARSGDARLPLSALNRALAAVARLSQTHPENQEVERLGQTLRELANFQLNPSDLETLLAATDNLLKIPRGPDALPAIQRAAKKLRDLRHRIAHAVPEAPRPAYVLDEEDDDA